MCNPLVCWKENRSCILHCYWSNGPVASCSVCMCVCCNLWSQRSKNGLYYAGFQQYTLFNPSILCKWSGIGPIYNITRITQVFWPYPVSKESLQPWANWFVACLECCWMWRYLFKLWRQSSVVIPTPPPPWLPLPFYGQSTLATPSTFLWTWLILSQVTWCHDDQSMVQQ